MTYLLLARPVRYVNRDVTPQDVAHVLAEYVADYPWSKRAVPALCGAQVGFLSTDPERRAGFHKPKVTIAQPSERKLCSKCAARLERLQ